MESFNIKSDLVDIENIKNFGNLRFFLSGDYIINKKGIGLYLTMLTIILTTIKTYLNL
jgi:hypothetical protein